MLKIALKKALQAVAGPSGPLLPTQLKAAAQSGPKTQVAPQMIHEKTKEKKDSVESNAKTGTKAASLSTLGKKKDLCLEVLLPPWSHSIRAHTIAVVGYNTPEPINAKDEFIEEAVECPSAIAVPQWVQDVQQQLDLPAWGVALMTQMKLMEQHVLQLEVAYHNNNARCHKRYSHVQGAVIDSSDVSANFQCQIMALEHNNKKLVLENAKLSQQLIKEKDLEALKDWLAKEIKALV